MDMLTKDAFHWNPHASIAFENLKSAVTTTPVLTLPDFTKPFVLQTDGCRTGTGVVLMQGDKPLAFLNYYAKRT